MNTRRFHFYPLAKVLNFLFPSDIPTHVVVIPEHSRLNIVLYIEPETQVDGVSLLFFSGFPFAPLITFFFSLVVEEADVLLNKGDAQLLGRVEDGHVVLAASWGGDVLDARFGGTIDVVGEGELLFC